MSLGVRTGDSSPSSPTAATGRLILMPAPLDLGEPPVDIRQTLPDEVLRVAASIRHWVSENARSTRAFLKRVAAVHPLACPLQNIEVVELPRPTKGTASRAAHRRAHANEPPNAPTAPRALLAPALQGLDLGLISEAGLPGVADPGAELVAAAHALGLTVLPLPGPSALMLALAASGLQGQRFAFVGYLPQDPTARTRCIQELESQSRRLDQTVIVIETPYRNRALMQALLSSLSPTTRLSVSIGITLPQGLSRTDTVAGWARQLQAAGAEVGERLPAVFLFLAQA